MSIRYLPPGLKEFECTAILGEDWSVGKGRVDWASFEPGKQARTYVTRHLCCNRDFPSLDGPRYSNPSLLSIDPESHPDRRYCIFILPNQSLPRP